MALHPLDNPVWAALSGRQQNFATGSGRFKCFRDDVGLFAAAARPEDGYEGLGDVMHPGAVVGIVTTAPIGIPAGLELVEASAVPQMVAASFVPAGRDVSMRTLADPDVPAMLELTGLTRPGPFFSRTIELGHYLGVFDGPRLVAMAGERMRLPGLTEISAVCTHPDYQGRGYAKALMSSIGREIVARGETPFLHVRAANAVAIATYRSLGFDVRREIIFTVLRRPA